MNMKLPSLCSILLFFLIAFPSIDSSTSSLIQITDTNWEQILEGDEWMIEFFAPWCPACRHLNPIWEDFSTWSSDLGIKVGQVDITTSPGLSGRFMIMEKFCKAYMVGHAQHLQSVCGQQIQFTYDFSPSHNISDGNFRQYRGSRSKDDFLIFIEESRWKTIEPVSSWYSPNSYLMAAVSGFYQLSMEMRNLLSIMTETYGIPVWMTYALCGLTTIFVGLLLGMILVFCIDCLYPQRPVVQRDTLRDKGAGDFKDEIDDEDIIDDLAENSNTNHDDQGDRKKDQ